MMHLKSNRSKNPFSLILEQWREMNALCNRQFYFIRHAETEENCLHLASGWLDSKLSKHGQLSSSQLDLDLPPEVSGFHSSLTRSRETAWNLLPDLKWEAMPELREHHFGDWEALPWTWVYRWLEQGFAPPQGESRAKFSLRIFGAWSEVLRKSEHTPVILGHGGHLFALGSLFGMKNSNLENLGCLHFVPQQNQRFPWETFKWNSRERKWIKTPIFI